MMMSDSIKSVQVVLVPALPADVCSLGYVTLIMRLIWYSDWAIIQQTFKHSPSGHFSAAAPAGQNV